MDCGGISGTLAGNVPFESGGHSGATDLTYAGVAQAPVRSPAVSGQNHILEASVHDDGHIDRNNTQPTALTHSQAHDFMVGNPVRTPVMDCGGNSGTVAGNVPLESWDHAGATDLTYAGVVQTPVRNSAASGRNSMLEASAHMAREIRLVLNNFISLIIFGPL